MYCQATGFGASGPYADVPTHGQMMDALGAVPPPMALDDDGFVVATGEAVGGSGGVVIGPLYAAFGVACALARRARPARGATSTCRAPTRCCAAKWLDALPMLNPELVDQDVGRR